MSSYVFALSEDWSGRLLTSPTSRFRSSGRRSSSIRFRVRPQAGPAPPAPRCHSASSCRGCPCHPSSEGTANPSSILCPLGFHSSERAKRWHVPRAPRILTMSPCPIANAVPSARPFVTVPASSFMPSRESRRKTSFPISRLAPGSCFNPDRDFSMLGSIVPMPRSAKVPASKKQSKCAGRPAGHSLSARQELDADSWSRADRVVLDPSAGRTGNHGHQAADRNQGAAGLHPDRLYSANPGAPRGLVRVAAVTG